jgi:hypothetical protein
VDVAVVDAGVADEVLLPRGSNEKEDAHARTSGAYM